MNAVFFNEYIQTSPRFMTDFTPWTLFVDTGIISVLLLLGKLMRVKIRFIQRLFIPPSLLAGFIGLSLGPHGFGIIPLSTQTGTYAGILIAMGFWRTVGIACPEPDMALEPCLRHHYAKRLLRRARYSSSHRTGFQPVRI